MDGSKSGALNRSQHRYFAEIDGLRAVAVLSVLIFHLKESFLPGGFLGVDVFFAISGFVVTQSIIDRKFASFGSFLSFFYARRLFRIFPLLGTVVVLTALAFVLFVPEAWLSRDIDRTGMAAILGLSNIVLSKGNDYFSPSASFNPFTHTWSLGVEEQFYLVFPFLMYFGVRFVRLRTAILIGLTLASLLVGLWWTQTQPLRAFYLLPPRFWELGAGMLLCLTADSWKPFLHHPGRANATVAVSALLLAVGLACPPLAGFPVPWAILPIAGTLGIIAGTLSRPDLSAAGLLRSRPALEVGRLSYSLYLWHWPVYVMMRWTVGLESWLDMAVAAGLTGLLSVLGYRWIEAPARDWQRRTGAGLRPIARAALAAGLVAVTAGTLFHYKPALTLSATGDLATWYPESENLRLPVGTCTVAEDKRDVAGVHLAVFAPEGCASPPDKGRLFVAGDSHTDHYARLLKRFAYETGREVRMYSLPGCGMVGFSSSEGSERCRDFESRLASDLQGALKPEDVMFLPTLRIRRFVNQWGDVGEAHAAQPASASPATINEARAEAVTGQLLKSGARIVFEAPTPVFKTVPFRCFDWFNRMNPLCRAGFSVPASELQERRAPVVAAMEAMVARFPRIGIWDPFPVLCPGPSCEAVRDGKPLFFDQDHLSGLGNDMLFPSFRAAITAEFAKNAAGEAGAPRNLARNADGRPPFSN
ncbi:acyltransferase family protein [Aureimonas leprariae]|uniref:acyltransferase family protein n=1 Tax=Plantimonas leprariae TaxID=2615207 RepID=UPI001386CF71|nr:acyltransferase family protein [Aureimonas leprariae]